jgi:hypothetical protein
MYEIKYYTDGTQYVIFDIHLKEFYTWISSTEIYVKFKIYKIKLSNLETNLNEFWQAY